MSHQVIEKRKGSNFETETDKCFFRPLGGGGRPVGPFYTTPDNHGRLEPSSNHGVHHTDLHSTYEDALGHPEQARFIEKKIHHNSYLIPGILVTATPREILRRFDGRPPLSVAMNGTKRVHTLCSKRNTVNQHNNLQVPRRFNPLPS